MKINSCKCAILTVLLTGIMNADAQKLTPFTDNTTNLMGLKDASGKVVIQPEYTDIAGYSDGLCLLQKGGKKGGANGGEFSFVDGTGKVVLKIDSNKYRYAVSFNDGIARVSDKKTKLTGFIDKTGKIVIPCKYTEIDAFSEGLAVCWTPNNTTGYINKAGKEVIPPKFQSAESFSHGIARVTMADGSYGLIDKTGKVLVQGCKFVYDYDAAVDRALVEKENNGKSQFSLIDVKGHTYPAAPPHILEGEIGKDGKFYDGMMAWVDANTQKVGYVDKDGMWKVSPIYDKMFAENFSEGLVRVCMNTGRYAFGYADKTGKLVIPCQYEWAERFMDGKANVTKAGVKGYVDAKGNFTKL